MDPIIYLITKKIYLIAYTRGRNEKEIHISSITLYFALPLILSKFVYNTIKYEIRWTWTQEMAGKVIIRTNT